MRTFVAILVVAGAVLATSVLSGRIEYWKAANADYLRAVERIAAIGSGERQRLDFSDLNHLGELPPEIATKSNLTRLNLSNTNVTDIGSVAGLKKLEELSMNNVPVRDLSPLSELNSLVDLSVSRTWVFDLEPISGLTKLAQLNLSYTAVKSLEPVLQLRRIKQLTLYSSYAHDGSREHYEKLTRYLPRVNNGSAYRQDYRPDWLYRMKIRYRRFKESWMIDRPNIS